MAERTIRCEDCGADYKTKRANTKYCRVCRLYRNLLFLKNRKKECPACGDQFAPLAMDDMVCGRCDIGRHYVDGTCALCGDATSKQLHPDVAVCHPCATDPSRRPLLIRALAKKLRAA